MQFGLNDILEGWTDIFQANLPSVNNPDVNTGNIGLQNIDSQLEQAAMKVLTSGSWTPLIKEELKTKIQAARLKRGKEELEVEFKEVQTYELREDEIEKIEKRKEANRLAAIRFRRKRKSRETQLEEDCIELETKNQKLLTEVSELEEEKRVLLEALYSIKSPP